jgi:hypothetical protein
MDIAKCLDLADELWTGDVDGPGRGMVELAASDGDCAEGRLTAEDVYALEGALIEHLTARRGAPDRRGTSTLQVRMSRGEEIPETWARLAAQAVELRTWRTPAGRWLILTVTDAKPDTGIRLLLAATDADPD